MISYAIDQNEITIEGKLLSILYLSTDKVVLVQGFSPGFSKQCLVVH